MQIFFLCLKLRMHQNRIININNNCPLQKNDVKILLPEIL